MDKPYWASEASREYNIPMKLMRAMIKEQVITQPLTKEDILFIQKLAKVHGNRHLTRLMLAVFKPQERERMAKTAELTKVESYVYSRYYNAWTSKTDKKRLNSVMIASEITNYFNLKGKIAWNELRKAFQENPDFPDMKDLKQNEIDKWVIGLVKKIKQKVKTDLYRERNMQIED